jgi:hypothetical protein
VRRVNFTKGDEKGGDMAEQKFKIVRNFFEGYPDKTIKRGLTEEEAQAWCKDPETSSSTAKGEAAHEILRKYGEWYDGYAEDKKR